MKKTVEDFKKEFGELKKKYKKHIQSFYCSPISKYDIGVFMALQDYKHLILKDKL